MFKFADDRVCPDCQVLLPEGRTVCPKCGQKVAPQRSGVKFIDLVVGIHPSLVRWLGPVWGNVAAGVLLILSFALFVGIAILIKWART